MMARIYYEAKAVKKKLETTLFHHWIFTRIGHFLRPANEFVNPSAVVDLGKKLSVVAHQLDGESRLLGSTAVITLRRPIKASDLEL